MSFDPSVYRLLAPGPVPVPAAVRAALAEPVLHHRTPQFEKILAEVWEELRSVFATKQPVMILSGSGSAAMEAAVVNILSPGDEVVCVVSGKFGERWADMCKRFGAVVTRQTVDWGSPVDLDQLAELLRARPKTRAVFTQACETSTATLHPVREFAALVRSLCPQALIAIDAITAVGCVSLPMDEWGLDVVVGGSQKAFMIPPGLAFIALSERAWAAQKSAGIAKYYLDLAAERRANELGENLFTIPTPLVVALGIVLRRRREVGHNRIEARAHVLAAATRDTGKSMGMKVFSRAPSPSVTALEIKDSAKVRDWLERERNITVMGGQDQLKNRVLRVGHMGDIRDEDMIALFTALAEHLGQNFAPTTLLKTLAAAPPLFD